MPGADAIPAGRNSVDGERPVRGGLRVVGMIEDGDPGTRPRMLVRHHLDLGRLAEAVDRHYLAVIVEWCDARDLSGPYVDETIRVDQSVVVADIERPACRYRLDVGVESAIGVVQLESALQWKRFAAPDVGNPHDGPTDTGSGERDVFLHD